MAAVGPHVRRAVSLGSGRRTPVFVATRHPPAPWKVRDAVLVMGAGFLFLVAALITTLGVFELQGGSLADSDARAVISTLVSAGFYLFLLWMIYVTVVHRYRVTWRSLGIRPVSWQWLAAVPFIFALLTFSYVLMYRAGVAVFGPATHWPKPLTTTTVNAAQLPHLVAVVIVTNVLLTPLVEELLFRGVLYQALRRSMPIGSSVLVSSLVFAAMHMSLVLFIPFMLMGIILAIVYERSESIVPTILLHACNNGIILLIIAGNAAS
jgi:CAAX protease family protein